MQYLVLSSQVGFHYLYSILSRTSFHDHWRNGGSTMVGLKVLINKNSFYYFCHYFPFLYMFLNHLIITYFRLPSSRRLSFRNHSQRKFRQRNFRLRISSSETCAAFGIVWPRWLVAGPEQKINSHIHIGIDCSL